MPRPNKWYPLQRKRDWHGRKVRLLRDVTNRAGDKISKGEICETTGENMGRVSITAPWLKGQTPRDGCRSRWVRNISIRDVELFEP